jgi:Ca-activated chloride channel family protein
VSGRALRRLFPAAILLACLCAAAGPDARAQDAQKRRGFSIKITQPVNGDIAIGKEKIEATVKTDRPDLIESVEFFVGDEMVFRDTEAPYECTYDFGPQSIARVIRAVAHHKEGITVSDVVVTRKIDLSFAVRVNRVVLDAVVQDQNGHFVHDLTANDLQLTEDGVARPIIDFSMETRPLSVALVIDTSGSMQEKMDATHKAAVSFVDTLQDNDQAMVIDFAEHVFLLQDLTSDHDAIREAIQTTTAVGATAIYDAVHAALRKLRPVEGRKAIILLSDGGDTDSQFPKDRVVEEAKAADVTIYSIGLGAGAGDFGAKELLRNFSEATGGKAYFVKEASELESTYRQITDDLRNQYYITYESDNEVFDGRWVKIEITPRNKAYEVRARKGYLAVKTGS